MEHGDGLESGWTKSPANLNQRKAVNAKTLGGKDARGGEMGSWGDGEGEDRLKSIHPTGEGVKQPKSLRLCTFTPLRWFHRVFQVEDGARRPEGFKPLVVAPKVFGTRRHTPASEEYLRRRAGLGQDSNPAKQCRIQLHVAVDVGRVRKNWFSLALIVAARCQAGRYVEG